MATSFTHEQRYGADPATVMAMLADPAFVERKCARTGSIDTTVDVDEPGDGTVVISATRVLPVPDSMPGAARKLVGDTITVKEVQTWTAPSADGSRTAAVAADFGGQVSFTATMALAPAESGSAIAVDGSLKAGIPFIGGKIEQIVAEQTVRYLDEEQRVGTEWLASA